jgi:imidazolonepropionase-like amidohydrolase
MIASFVRKGLVSLLLVLWGAFALTPRLQASQDITAFVHVNVLTMDREQVLGDQTVVVRGDRIHEIGPSGSVGVPTGATVIDGAGKFLMPGLCDMHTHFFDEGDLLLFVANGVTTVRNLHGYPMHLVWREQVRRDERLGPTIYTSGPILDGDPPNDPSFWSVASPEVARKLVDIQIAAGYDCIKVMNLIRRDVCNAIMDEARRHGIPVVGHVPTDVGLRHVLESGQSSIEHFDGYGMASARNGDRLKGLNDRYRGYFEGWDNVDETKFADLIALTLQAGTWICPTLTAFRRTLMLQENPRHALHAPEARFLAPSLVGKWKKWNPSSALIDAARRVEPIRERALKQLYDAGVPILLGTDCSMPNVVVGFSVIQELQYLVEIGLTPYQAISTGTSAAASFLGEAGEFGTVTVGKRADLLLVEADPLEDVGNVSKRAGVMVRGQWYSDGDMRVKLETLAHRYAQ